MKEATCLGGNKIVLNEGYWRSSNKTDVIYTCLSKKSCQGGFVENETLPVICKDGHTGPLCSVCIFDETRKFMWSGVDGCNKCPNMIFNYFKVFALLIVYVIYVGGSIFINIRKKRESNLAILVKILVNYFSILSTCLSFSFWWPSFL